MNIPHIPLTAEASELEAEYNRIKVTLYKQFFTYLGGLTIAVMIMEILQVVYYSRTGNLIALLVILVFGSMIFRFISRLEKNQEVSITVYIIVFFLSTLITTYCTDSGYFNSPVEAYNFAYAFAVCERLFLTRITKLSHRTAFVVIVTLVRVFVIYTDNLAIFGLQFVYLFFTLFLDIEREKYDQNFLSTYFRNKEQLLKFKNLVVQDIPESITIINQDLTQPLFVNNSFEKLIEDKSNLNIRDKLRRFLIHESFENSSTDDTSWASSSPLERQNLLAFLESTIHKQDLFSANQKFSCNLTYKKTVNDLQDETKCTQEYIFEAKAIHLLWDEQPAIAVILHDITQQHTILSLKLADAHKDTILATVSHELRTPLNGILGMIQIMEKRIKDSEMLTYLKICKNSADLLLSLVNSILDLNQIRAKKLKLFLERVNVKELLEGIISLFEFQCRQKGLYLKLKIAPNCSKYLITDKNRLRQILINLIGNALKFTKKGGIAVSAFDTSNTENITFSVEDTGTGIKDEDKHRLFRSFGKIEQIDKDMNPHGVGLGLSISNKLAKVLQNDEKGPGIRLESKLGKGSSFIFSIKKYLQEPSSPGELEAPELHADVSMRTCDERGDIQSKMETYSRQYRPSSQRTSVPKSLNLRSFIDPPLQTLSANIPRMDASLRYRSESFLSSPTKNNLPLDDEASNEREVLQYVLIIDDNPLNTLIAEHLITSHGYRSKSALYGQDAIDIILNCNYTKEPIKLILMDCQMPGMNGFMVTKILKKMMAEKRIPEIPIIALTANDGDSDREATRKAGMFEHITKPLKEVELVRILNKYMKK